MKLKRKEHEEKLKKIMLKEGTYLRYLRFLKRGALHKTARIVEDIYDRHGQNLDGDLDAKYNEDDVKEELGFKEKENEVQ